MDAPSAAELVRQLVRKSFAELGLDRASLEAMEESLLVNEGRYHARTYVAGDCMAMWMIDVRLIQFYGPNGEMLRMIDLAQQPQPSTQEIRKAA